MDLLIAEPDGCENRQQDEEHKESRPTIESIRGHEPERHDESREDPDEAILVPCVRAQGRAFETETLRKFKVSVGGKVWRFEEGTSRSHKKTAAARRCRQGPGPDYL